LEKLEKLEKPDKKKMQAENNIGIEKKNKIKK
jgi:hypothetical protein